MVLPVCEVVSRSPPDENGDRGCGGSDLVGLSVLLQEGQNSVSSLVVCLDVFGIEVNEESVCFGGGAFLIAVDDYPAVFLLLFGLPAFDGDVVSQLLTGCLQGVDEVKQVLSLIGVVLEILCEGDSLVRAGGLDAFHCWSGSRPGRDHGRLAGRELCVLEAGSERG